MFRADAAFFFPVVVLLAGAAFFFPAVVLLAGAAFFFPVVVLLAGAAFFFPVVVLLAGAAFFFTALRFFATSAPLAQEKNVSIADRLCPAALRWLRVVGYWRIADFILRRSSSEVWIM